MCYFFFFVAIVLCHLTLAPSNGRVRTVRGTLALFSPSGSPLAPRSTPVDRGAGHNPPSTRTTRSSQDRFTTHSTSLSSNRNRNLPSSSSLFRNTPTFHSLARPLIPFIMATFEAKVKSVLSGDTVILHNLHNPKQERTLSLAYVTAPRLRREGDEVSICTLQLPPNRYFRIPTADQCIFT